MLIFKRRIVYSNWTGNKKKSRFNWKESLHRQEQWIKRTANLVTKYLETTFFSNEGLKLANFLIFRCFEKIHYD